MRLVLLRRVVRRFRLVRRVGSHRAGGRPDAVTGDEHDRRSGRECAQPGRCVHPDAPADAPTSSYPASSTASRTSVSKSGAWLVTVTWDCPLGTRSMLTPVTPPSLPTSSVTAETQCEQVIPETAYVVVDIVVLLDVSIDLESGADQAGDRVGGLPDLRVRDAAALRNRICDAVRQVVVQQCERDGLQRPRGRGNLRQHVDAIGLVVDHALQPAHLALDLAQPREHRVLVLDVTGHRVSFVEYFITPWGYAGQPLPPRGKGRGPVFGVPQRPGFSALAARRHRRHGPPTGRSGPDRRGPGHRSSSRCLVESGRRPRGRHGRRRGCWL